MSMPKWFQKYIESLSTKRADELFTYFESVRGSAADIVTMLGITKPSPDEDQDTD